MILTYGGALAGSARCQPSQPGQPGKPSGPAKPVKPARPSQANQANQSQGTRFDDFLPLAPIIDKTNPRRLDLLTFLSWLQKSTKPIPGGSI